MMIAATSMVDGLNSLMLRSMLLMELDKSTGHRELGVVEDVVLEGTKTFARLDKRHYLYGVLVYKSSSLPLVGRIDLDKTVLQHVCDVIDWHFSKMPTKEKEAKVLTFPPVKIVEDRSAILVSNLEECSDVEWSEA